PSFDAAPPDAAPPATFGDNFDFEDWSASDPPPQYTKSAISGFTIAQETSIVSSGNSSAAITWTATTNRDLEHAHTYTAASTARHTFHIWAHDNDVNGRLRP